ncbi:MAG: UDP-N-acetylmuramate:L-alanyl-gamma-D-glutamyl-meso-diaminopimelate ligase [Methylococcales bacterium]|nr:UDP-N-acetylmuramate:L-alanyl-gamma-D-glutamyl-meso-diaminopimelate ligase [Methylococcales bacterium]
MHIHILGICGTFMGGLALIARELGHQVSGSDENVYPPMSTQLEEQGVSLIQGYQASNLDIEPDLIIIGNALSRGNAEVEAVLNKNLPYISGAQWLSEHVLQKKWVLAVAGTHGKTTTTSMLAWVLEHQGFQPGFLIGGVALNFSISARLGQSDFFIIEADEYDCAFFDKRSKFVHYRPRTLVINNLEYDHADIFPDLAAIQRQFHHLLRTVPSDGLVIAPENNKDIETVLKMGSWTPISYTGINQDSEWDAQLIKADGTAFEVFFKGKSQGIVQWTLTGNHNVYNALSAIVSARHIGILPRDAIIALGKFKNVKRRMEVIAKIKGVTLYDDFAHHPTAIKTTLAGLRNQVGDKQIIALVDPRSNTMKMGIHNKTLAGSLKAADIAIIYQPDALDWTLSTLEKGTQIIKICKTLDEVIRCVMDHISSESYCVLMSNGSFGGLHQRLQTELSL